MCCISAHQGRVTDVRLVEAHSWLLSCSSADKCFTCFSTETGQRLSGYLLGAPCTCLLYPFVACRLFAIEQYFISQSVSWWKTRPMLIQAGLAIQSQ